MAVEISKGGKIVSRSKNLRGILTYAKRCGGAVLRQDGNDLIVSFGDGATCQTRFASKTVLSLWIGDRVKYSRNGLFSQE